MPATTRKCSPRPSRFHGLCRAICPSTVSARRPYLGRQSRRILSGVAGNSVRRMPTASLMAFMHRRSGRHHGHLAHSHRTPGAVLTRRLPDDHFHVEGRADAGELERDPVLGLPGYVLLAQRVACAHVHAALELPDDVQGVDDGAGVHRGGHLDYGDRAGLRVHFDLHQLHRVHLRLEGRTLARLGIQRSGVAGLLGAQVAGLGSGLLHLLVGASLPPALAIAACSCSMAFTMAPPAM